MSRQIVLDTETTGLNAAEGDRIIEIGCVELLGHKPTGNHLHLYLNPQGRESHEDALKVHGISNEFLQDKPTFAEAAEQILAFVAGTEVIIHNAKFDVGFLDAELDRMGRPAFHRHVQAITDTLEMAKKLYPGKRNSLDALCDRLEVDNSGRTLHGALLDAQLLAEVYINLTRGQEALLIDLGAVHPSHSASIEPVDLSGLVLPVLEANEMEMAAHEQALAELDKVSKGKTVWRRSEGISA